MIIPASGTGIYSNKTAKIIRFVRKGCTNRPFFHITVTERHMPLDHPGIEQLGTYDPLPNQWNEKLISLNYERVRYWIGNGAHLSNPVEQLLGLAGIFPIHPTSYIAAWRNRRAKYEAEEKNSVESNKSQ